MSITMSSIQSWVSDVQSTLTSLPTALEQAAPTGAFAAVLARVAATMEAGPAGTAAATTSTGTGTGAAAGGTKTIGTASAGAVSFGGLLPMTTGGTAAGSGGVTGQDVVDEARSFLGTPYVWGGESPTGFDCSGLVQYTFGQLGVSLPRTSEEQALVGTPVSSLTQARPGDLVFFAGSDGTPTSPGHVGIYIGNGEMIDAPYTGTDVQVDPVGQPVAIRRVLPQTGAGGGGGLSALTDGSPAAAGATAAASTGSTLGSGVPSTLAPLFVAAAGKYGVPVTLLTAVANHESRFETNAVSSAGAEGLMQIMPGTAAGLGVTPFTPGEAIDGAAQLLSGYIQQFGSVPLALAAYDAGAGAVEQYGGIPPYAETQAYVQTIMQTIGGTS